MGNKVGKNEKKSIVEEMITLDVDTTVPDGVVYVASKSQNVNDARSLVHDGVKYYKVEVSGGKMKMFKQDYEYIDISRVDFNKVNKNGDFSYFGPRGGR